jgi:hypothetical protein
VAVAQVSAKQDSLPATHIDRNLDNTTISFSLWFHRSSKIIHIICEADGHQTGNHVVENNPPSASAMSFVDWFRGICDVEDIRMSADSSTADDSGFEACNYLMNTYRIHEFGIKILPCNKPVSVSISYYSFCTYGNCFFASSTLGSKYCLYATKKSPAVWLLISLISATQYSLESYRMLTKSPT